MSCVQLEQNTSSDDRDADWREELKGLPTEEYINSCKRISAINYKAYLAFTSNDDITKSQAHSDWKDTIVCLLDCKHPGLLQMGKGLQRKWDKGFHKYTDDLHWAVMKRKQTAKLQSVKVTSLADASVNNMTRRVLQDELDRASKATSYLIPPTSASSSRKLNPIVSPNHAKPSPTTTSLPYIPLDDLKTARDRSKSIADNESTSSLLLPSESEEEDIDTPRTSSSSSAAAETDTPSLSSTESEQNFWIPSISPFPDLIAKLYEIHSHKPPKLNPRTTPFPSTTITELYNHAQEILEDWNNQPKINQKDCLVALSGIVNTIDVSNSEYYSNFEEIRAGCHIKDFFTITERQNIIIQALKTNLGVGKRQKLSRLRRFCSRRYNDLEELLEGSDWEGQDEDSLEEELAIMKIMEFLCTEIEAIAKSTNLSEVEDVVIWRNIARVLFHGEMVPRMGELGSQSTREDRVKVEGIFGGSQSNVKSRKIDLFFQKPLPGFSKPWEICSWEAKSTSVGAEELQVQRRKNLRINASIANKTTAIACFASPKNNYPLPSAVILDIEGLRALPYVIRKIEPGVFGAGTVTEAMTMICLPQTAEDIVNFLDNGHMSALLSIKKHNVHFAKLVKQGAMLFKNEAALAKMMGMKIENSDPCIINTPTKAQKRKQEQQQLPQQQKQQKQQHQQQQHQHEGRYKTRKQQ